jgi:replicative DNA helicase
MNFDKYLTCDHQPYAKPVRDLYLNANEELLRPYPSVPFKNFPIFNQMTGGLRPYEFTILCGGTGTGKTTLAANLSRDFLESNTPHFVASVETGHTDYIKRIISSLARRDWNGGDAVPVDALKRFHQSYGEMFLTNNFWLSLYDNRVTVETLMSDIAFMVKNNGTKVAIVDNLNFFMEITRANDSLIEMDRVIHELIIFCKQVPVHVIMVMHPKKTEDGRIESELDVKGSSSSIQEAHNVLLWNRPHPDLIKKGVATSSDRELKIAKMRRRGKYVHRRLIFKSTDGVYYTEGDLV